VLWLGGGRSAPAPVDAVRPLAPHRGKVDSQRAQDVWSVVDYSVLRSRRNRPSCGAARSTTTVRPATRRVCCREVPPIASTNPRATDIQTDAGGVVVIAEALERFEDRSSVPRGTPGPSRSH